MKRTKVFKWHYSVWVDNVTPRNHYTINQIPKARYEIHPQELLTLEPPNTPPNIIFLLLFQAVQNILGMEARVQLNCSPRLRRIFNAGRCYVSCWE